MVKFDSISTEIAALATIVEGFRKVEDTLRAVISSCLHKGVATQEEIEVLAMVDRKLDIENANTRKLLLNYDKGETLKRIRHITFIIRDMKDIANCTLDNATEVQGVLDGVVAGIFHYKDTLAQLIKEL